VSVESPKSSRNIIVYASEAPRAQAPVEMCEHKGTGHPDTVTDAVCEAVALQLVREYEKSFRRCLHFNVDKGLLVGGTSEPKFGGGRLVTRPKLIVCGRASNPQARLDMPALVFGAAGRWLDDNLAPGAALFELVSEVREARACGKYSSGTRSAPTIRRSAWASPRCLRWRRRCCSWLPSCEPMRSDEISPRPARTSKSWDFATARR
jgi:S-adenosylmethionine synthetase